MTPQKCSHPNPWNLEMCCLPWQKGLADVTKLMTWDGESPLDYPGGPSVSTGGEPFAAEFRERGRWDCRQVVREIQHFWLWRWRYGAMSQGMWVASKSKKSQRKVFTPKAFRRNAALLTPWFLASEAGVRFLTYTTAKAWVYVGLSHEVCGDLSQQPQEMSTEDIGKFWCLQGIHKRLNVGFPKLFPDQIRLRKLFEFASS